nr:hypothetical protein [Arthrobacter liuii]
MTSLMDIPDGAHAECGDGGQQAGVDLGEGADGEGRHQHQECDE